MAKKMNINGNRLALLRAEKGWSQEMFAKKFAEFAPRYDSKGNIKPPLACMTVSNWETGRKIPPSEVLAQLAAFYGVSFDYICGRTNNSEINSGKDTNIYKADIVIKYQDLHKYNGKPVFLQFNNPKYTDQWGILNTEQLYALCLIGKVKLDKAITYLVSEPLINKTIHNSETRYLLGMRDMMSKEMFYVEPISADERVAYIMRGWYIHSKDKKYIINKKNGYILPYEALGETYNAYSNK